VNGRGLVLFAAKEREARGVLPQLIRAVATMDDLQLVVKPHPAETADVYTSVVGAAPNVRVVEPSAPLPALLAAARAIVTVNSTVAIDAMAIGVPSLVIGLPNNLSPFVERGLMLGAGGAEEIRASLLKLLYDQEFPKRLVRGAVGRAAARSADAILALARDGESKCAC
jgi:CDP-glycerol glycerophosphotransferase (TagB/SpsB family)